MAARATPAVVTALLLGPLLFTAAAPGAVALGPVPIPLGLNMLVFPEGPDPLPVGANYTLWVEAYYFSQLTDLQNISAYISDSGVGFRALNVTHVGAGRYRVDATVLPEDLRNGLLCFDLWGAVHGAGDRVGMCTLVAGQVVGSGIETMIRMVTPHCPACTVSPDDELTFEVLGFVNGSLHDVDGVGAYANRFVNGTSKGEELPVERIRDGVYQAHTIAAPGMNRSARLWVSASRVHDGMYSLDPNHVSVDVEPVPAAVVVTDVGPRRALVEVRAGSDLPIAGADAEVRWHGSSPGPGGNPDPEGVATGKTDASGYAAIPIVYSVASLGTVQVNVSVGESVSTYSVGVSLGSPSGWLPAYRWAYENQFVASLQTDPTTLAPGDHAQLQVKTSVGDVPYAGHNVSAVVWQKDHYGTSWGRNYTTGADGTFVLELDVPPRGSNASSTRVLVINSTGDLDGFDVAFGVARADQEQSIAVETAWDQDTGTLTVDARPGSGSWPPDTRATAWVVPSADVLDAIAVDNTGTRPLSGRYAGNLPRAELAIEGESGHASIALPRWFPDGNATVVVEASHVPPSWPYDGAQVMRGFSVVTVGETTGVEGSPRSADSAGTATPTVGSEDAFVILVVAVPAMFVAVVWAVRRRRRAGDR